MKAVIMDMCILSHETHWFLMFGHVVGVGVGKLRGLPWFARIITVWFYLYYIYTLFVKYNPGSKVYFYICITIPTAHQQAFVQKKIHMNPRQLLDTFLGAITGFLVVVLLVDLVSSQAETLEQCSLEPGHGTSAWKTFGTTHFSPASWYLWFILHIMIIEISI